jgi:hypothetical protein
MMAAASAVVVLLATAAVIAPALLGLCLHVIHTFGPVRDPAVRRSGSRYSKAAVIPGGAL